jgi:putative phosphoesterase
MEHYMKIIVFSDSHRDVDTMIIATNYEKPDMIIHLGDYVGDAIKLREAFPDIPIKMVKGNGDITTHYKNEEILVINGKKILLTHGHRHSVKMGVSRLVTYGLYSEADIILFGHTHFPYLQQYNDAWVMNPGRSVNIPGINGKTSYGLVTFKEDDFKCEIVDQT